MWAARLARWWALIGAGCLLSQALVFCALLAAPRFLDQAFVAPDLKLRLCVLVLAHFVVVVAVMRFPTDLLAILGFAVLAGDAQLAGVLLGRDSSLSSPALAVVLVTILNVVAVGGWLAPLVCTSFYLLGMHTAVTHDAPIATAWLPRVLVDSTLSVEPRFAGRVAVLLGQVHIDIGPPLIYLLPLAVGFTCWILGACFNLWWVERRERMRPAIYAATVVLLSVLVSNPASATSDCRETGRGRFVEGLLALSRHDLSSALTAFQRLVSEQPACPEARNNLAVVLTELGRLEEAAEQLQAASRQHPNYRRASENLKRLSALQSKETADESTAPLAQRDVVAGPAVVPPRAMPSATVSPTVVPTPTATESVPPTAFAFDSRASPVCVINANTKRICFYRRRASALTSTCWTVDIVGMDLLPPWLVVGSWSDRHLWLLDESGERSLLVAADPFAEGESGVSMQPAALAALRNLVAPLRTTCVLNRNPMEESETLDDALGSLRGIVEAWRLAWSEQRLSAYEEFYSDDFIPQKEPNRVTWLTRRQATFDPEQPIGVEIATPTFVVMDGGATGIVTFAQHVERQQRRYDTTKVMHWRREGEVWRVLSETSLHETPTIVSHR